MFRCSYTIIRERINSCLLKLQLFNSPLKYVGVWLIRWWCGCVRILGPYWCMCVALFGSSLEILM
jgi:hypothetical protein